MGRLQTARLENFIRRWGSIKGGGSVLSETLGDVFPMLDLENLTPENQLVAGWQLFWAFATVIGVSAQLPGASIINPADSGNIVVVDSIIFRTEAAANITIGSSLPLFTPVGNVVPRDTRGPAFSGKARFGANSNVGAAENGLLLRTATAIDRQVEIPNSLAVLQPGTQLAIVSALVNIDLTVSFIGRARIAEPSELSF